MRSASVEWGVRLGVIASLALLLTIVARTNIVRGLNGRFFSWLEAPFTVVADSVGDQGELIFSSRRELIEELQTREQQVLELARTAAAWEQAERERDEALQLLGYRERTGIPILTAKVRVRSSATDSDSVLIDRGAVDGVQTGEAVVTGEGVLYGFVQEVWAHTARVVRLTDPSMRLGAGLLDETHTIGVVEGGYGPVVRMAFVAQNTEVAVNDVIVTSGVDARVPPGIVIGLVNVIEEDPNAPFLTLFVEPFAAFTRTRVLGIVQSEL